jgi:hypothetical protein
MEPREEVRIGSELTTNARAEPIGVVGTAMRRAKRDTPIDATRTPELLDVDPSNQSPEAVANEIDAATADVPPKVLTQTKRRLLHPGA